GPGQLTAYCLFDLKRLDIGPRAFVEKVEDAIVSVLQELGIPAEANRDAHGVYVNGKKIASLGLRIRKGCAYHGLSLNVDMDLEPFTRINPCGYAGLQM
ncbi:MAG: lipoyl(octanoyl) transferase LipB, partial [Gammaproteobacteria bacterium]